MPENDKTLIMKFGGAAVQTVENFSKISDIIIKKSLTYARIAIVVSAMGKMTDQLIGLAQKIHPSPPRREYDMLVSAGERISISLLAMALMAKGRQAVSFTGSQSGIITTSEHTEAKIIDVRPFRLLEHLNQKKMVIIAGFQGVSEEKEITTLGRGGSDTSAVALAAALGAEKVEFYKDVAGIFSKDPKQAVCSLMHNRLSFKEARSIVSGTGGKVLHPRALQLAEKNAIPLDIKSFIEEEEEGTLIDCSSRKRRKRPLYEEGISPRSHRIKKHL